jgi:NAD(P)-dependent dehydrogenase (short-subunit alcohol dehydrogenase family)
MNSRHQGSRMSGSGAYYESDLISRRPPSTSSSNGRVEGFVRAAALELDRGVRINAVSPGNENSGSAVAQRPGAAKLCHQPVQHAWRRVLRIREFPQRRVARQ